MFDLEVCGTRVSVDRQRRRVLLPFPVPYWAFEERSPFVRVWLEVCGPTAELNFYISARLGRLAICAVEEADAWRAEIDG